MNIPELRLKIKGIGDALMNRELYTALLIILVGLSSFGLGRLSLLQGHKTGITVTTLPAQAAFAVSSAAPAPEAKNDAPPLPKGGQVVASKSGAKYHFPWCSGAQRISEANKVWFDSIEDARKAGYTPASNCKGLQ